MLNKKPFRIGIVGVGLISQQSHIPAALSFTDVRVDALIDPEYDRARQIHNLFGMDAEIAKSIEEVSCDLDAVIIASPNHTHAMITKYCLQKNIHVLIEKPISASWEDACQISEMTKSTGLTVAIGYCTRFRDNVKLAKVCIDDQYFGELTSFAYQFGTPGGWPSLSGYHLDAGAAGGGVLIVSGSHFIDRMLHFFGYPDDFKYWDDSMGGPEANAKLEMTFRRAGKEISGVARFSKTVWLPGGLVLETTQGKLILKETDHEPLVFIPKDKPELKMQVMSNTSPDEFATMNVFQRQLRNFVNACRNKSQPLISADEGKRSLEFIQAAYQRKESLLNNMNPVTQGI